MIGNLGEPVGPQPEKATSIQISEDDPPVITWNNCALAIKMRNQSWKDLPTLIHAIESRIMKFVMSPLLV